MDAGRIGASASADNFVREPVDYASSLFRLAKRSADPLRTVCPR